MTTVICHSRIQTLELFRLLNIPKITFSNTILPDIIFNDCVPSLAIIFCENPCENRLINVQRINQLQKEFRNSFAIILGISDEAEWIDFQIMVEFGNCRLIRVENSFEAVTTLQQIHENMKNRTKFELQAKILDEYWEKLSSPEELKKLIMTIFQDLEIPPQESEQIVLRHRTIRNIITNINDRMDPITGKNCYSDESARKISCLFQDITELTQNALNKSLEEADPKI